MLTFALVLAEASLEFDEEPEDETETVCSTICKRYAYLLKEEFLVLGISERLQAFLKSWCTRVMRSSWSP
jgi:hypothetical protein